MRPQHHSSDRDDFAHYFIIFTQRPVQLIVIVFEFIFLKQHDPSTVRYVHTHAIWGEKEKGAGVKKEEGTGVKEGMKIRKKGGRVQEVMKGEKKGGYGNGV
jgi:hypothetical protein